VTWWLVAGILGVSPGLACTGRDRTFCGYYAEAVSDCCSDHSYAGLQAICDQDLGIALSVRSGCAQAVRDLYDCAEARACTHECEVESPDPCEQRRQAMLGICARSPVP
jgi:hypothetical protein